MCDKNYGRRDYLDRHLKTHDPENQSKRIKLTSNTAGKICLLLQLFLQTDRILVSLLGIPCHCFRCRLLTFIFFPVAGLVDWVVNSGQMKHNSSTILSGSTNNGISNAKDDSECKTDDGDDSSPPVKIVKKKRRDIPAEEKKICLWVLEDGTACGKTFTKFDR